jgi:hypothetical protein
MLSARHFVLASGTVLTLLAGCSATPVVRIAHPEEVAGPPAIEQLVDLGGMPLAALGELSQEHRDDRLTPGEWVAVLGRSLANKPMVAIDGRPVPVAGYVQGGSLLIRVPRGISPRGKHRLQVRTPYGEATTTLRAASHLVAADLNGKSLRTLLMTHDTDRLLDHDPQDIDLKESYFHTLNASGNLLYVLQWFGTQHAAPDGRTYTGSTIATLHMAARDKPQHVGSFPVATFGSPKALGMLDDSTLLVLSERDLVVMDVSRMGGEAEVARIDLPVIARPEGVPVQYQDMVVLQQPPSVAVLEVFSNSVSLINLQDRRAPRLEASLTLSRQLDVPWSIDIAPDPADGRSLWVLQGPNFRIAGDKLRQVIERVQAKADDVFAVLTGQPAAQAAPPAEPPASPAPGVAPVPVQPAPGAQPPSVRLSRLVRLRAEGQALRLVEERALPPSFFPFFAHARAGGEVLVSGINANVFRFGALPLSIDGLKQAISVVTDSVQVGTIVAVKKDAPFRPVVQGIAIYFGMETLPDGTLAYSMLRPGVQAIPPGMVASWGIEAEDKFVELRTLEWTSLIPPYAVGAFAVQ